MWRDTTGKEYRTQNLPIQGVNKKHTGNYTCAVNVDSIGGYGTLTGEISTRITVQCKYISIIIIWDNLNAILL